MLLSLPKTRSILAFILAFCVITIVVIVGFIMIARFGGWMTEEDLAHLTGSITKKEWMVIEDLMRLGDLISDRYWGPYDDRPCPKPPDRLEDLFDPEFLNDPDWYLNHGRFRYLDSGIDPWGTPFYYRKDPIGDVGYWITVRSFGANRRDDGGKGDDIERRYLTAYK